MPTPWGINKRPVKKCFHHAPADNIMVAKAMAPFVTMPDTKSKTDEAEKLRDLKRCKSSTDLFFVRKA